MFKKTFWWQRIHLLLVDGSEEPAGDNVAQAAQGGFKPIESQAELDQIVGKRVARERAKYADYDTIQEAKKAAEARLQELEVKAAELESAQKASGVESAVLRAAVKYHLDEADLDFIHASSAEEVEERAKRFAERVHASGKAPSEASASFGRDAGGADGLENDLRKAAKQLFTN